MSDQVVDILIVGAGFAGLAAADTVAQYNAALRDPTRRPLTIAVLEGTERAGGRTRTVARATVTEPGKPAVDRDVGYLDVGGEYLGTTQSYMQTLVERFAIPTFVTSVPADKDSVYQAPDLKPSPQQPHPPPQLTYFQGNYPLTYNVVQVIEQIELGTQLVKANLADPWNALLARELDNVTVKDWAQRALGPDDYGQELMQLAIRCAFSVEWDQLSMLYLLFYGATTGSFEAFENVTGSEGGDRIRFTFGTKTLVDALVASLNTDPKKPVVRFGHRVTQIEQQTGPHGEPSALVTVETAHGKEIWKASQVVVAMSPGPSAKIEYRPALPPDRAGLAKGMVMGKTIKGFLLYDTPWWRVRYSGYVLSAKGPACWVMDNTWEDPQTGALGQPSLMTFIAGRDAERYGALDKEARAKLLTDQVNQLFFDANPTPPIGYVEGDWQTSPAGGCPAAVPGIGDQVRYKSAIRDPFGVVHWAGSESGLEWVGGYMNGAVQSGVRAAGEAVNAIVYAVGAGASSGVQSSAAPASARNSAAQ